MAKHSEHDRIGSSLAVLATALYFAQGLPFGFVVQSLPVMLRQQGVDLALVGLSSWVAMPWALKFLWAPWIDRARPPWGGKRFGVIIPTLFASIVALLALAWIDSQALVGFVLLAVVLNVLAATQDIATDGLAVERTPVAARGVMNAIQIVGYRVGMVVGGGLILMWIPRLGWSRAIVLLAICMAVVAGIVAWQAFGEPTDSDVARDPEPRVNFRHWLGRRETLAWLAGIVAYKFGDALMQGVLKPYMVDRGLDLADIGALVGTGGFVASMAGAAVGGVLLSRMDRRVALLVFGGLQAASIAGYVSIDALGSELDLGNRGLWIACLFEHFAGSLSSVALFTIMMDRCRPECAGADYTMQSCAQVVAGGVAMPLAGVLAAQIGYRDFFWVATAVSVLGVGVATRVFATSGRLARPSARPESRAGRRGPPPVTD